MIKKSLWILHLKAITKYAEIVDKRLYLSAGIFLLLSTLMSCTSYEIKSVANENQWAVYQNDYLIPEYTANVKNEFPNSRVEAETVFDSRKDRIENLIRMKYEKLNPWKNKFIVLTPVFVLSDIFYTAVVGGVNVCRAIVGKEKHDFVWFPSTRWVLHGSPLNVSKKIPTIRESWLNDLEGQKELETILGETAF